MAGCAREHEAEPSCADAGEEGLPDGVREKVHRLVPQEDVHRLAIPPEVAEVAAHPVVALGASEEVERSARHACIFVTFSKARRPSCAA